MKASGKIEPIRLFKSDFLEFFSHISPTAVAVIWAPVFVGFLIRSIMLHSAGTSILYIPVGFLLGWLIWTFVEYSIHRFIFHYHPNTERAKEFFFVAHGVHHAQPLCKTRLVMPPAVSIPLALLFLGIFYLLFVVTFRIPHLLPPTFSGFIAGYLIYDLMHYRIHHARKNTGLFARFRKHHLRHHGRCVARRFGISSPLWDYIFGTMPVEPDCRDLPIDTWLQDLMEARKDPRSE